MSVEQYALIDEANNLVVSTVMWDGNTETWQSPVGFYAVTEAGRDYFVWTLNEEGTDWVLAPQEGFLGGNEIGALFDGQNFVTQEPKPAPVVQPVSDGTQTL